MTTTNSKPLETLRDGAIKATIWENPSDKGAFYRVTLARTWVDQQGKYRDSDSLTGSQLLRASRLLTAAYDRTRELRKARGGRDDQQ